MDAAVPQIVSTGRLSHLLLLLLVCLEGQGNRCANAVSCCHKVKVNGGHKVNLIHIKHVSLGSKLTSAGWFSRLRFLTSNLYIPLYCPVYPHISPLYLESGRMGTITSPRFRTHRAPLPPDLLDALFRLSLQSILAPGQLRTATASSNAIILGNTELIVQLHENQIWIIWFPSVLVQSSFPPVLDGGS